MKENPMIPYEGMEPFIYVSYSHKDSKRVHQIIDGMCRQGYRVWWDAGFLPGESFVESMREHVTRCAVFMCLISRSCVESHYVWMELEFARKEDKIILPVFLEDVRLPPSGSFMLGTYQHIQFNHYGNISGFIDRLNQSTRLEITRARNFPNRPASTSGESDSQKAEERINSKAVQECKVIFLGDGAAGKSSLIDRMVNHRFRPNSLPTEGIKMTKWETSFEGGPFVLRILDFGGQEIMHSMHRCFLTSHTVYVVVCESRDDTEIDSVAARWLETVKAFAPDCPVILALNKADLNSNVSVNKKELQKRNPRLAAILRTSAAVEPEEKYGVAGLIDAIWKEIPDCINRYEADADMLGVKLEMENMEEPYITAEAYQKICEKHSILQSGFQRSLLDWFKDLGVAYFYEPKRLDTLVKSVRVLNPAWLTNGIYRLILRTPNSGFLSHDIIKETLQAAHEKDVLPDLIYTPRETEYILHVMEIFEISHDIGNGMEMIPLKMPKTPPNRADQFPKEQALHLRWKGTYLPNNVIHRLMIRKFPELDTNCVWRTGGRFEKADSQCTALAEMNENTLDVYVTGEKNTRKYYMESFRDEIRMILVGLHIRADETICQRINGKEGEIPYNGAMDALEKRMKQIPIYGINEYVSPKKLIREVYPDMAQERKRYRYEQSDGFNAEDFDHITAGIERIVNVLLKVGAVVFGLLILTGILTIVNPTLREAIIELLKSIL